jgi:hypothetical protein
MDLPCLLTRVGLLQDEGGPTDVWTIDPQLLCGEAGPLLSEVEGFLTSLESRCYQPRSWILGHATLAHAATGWKRALQDFQGLSGWELGLG